MHLQGFFLLLEKLQLYYPFVAQLPCGYFTFLEMQLWGSILLLEIQLKLFDETNLPHYLWLPHLVKTDSPVNSPLIPRWFKTDSPVKSSLNPHWFTSNTHIAVFQVLAAQEEIIRKEKELQKARQQLATIYQHQNRFKEKTPESDDQGSAFWSPHGAWSTIKLWSTLWLFYINHTMPGVPSNLGWHCDQEMYIKKSVPTSHSWLLFY